MAECGVRMVIGARFNLDRNSRSIRSVNHKVHFTALFCLIVVKLAILGSQLLSHHVFVHAAEVGLLAVEVRRLGDPDRIAGHQHPGIGLVQLELGRPRRLKQRGLGLGHDVGLESDAGIDKPDKISLVFLVMRLGIYGVEHETLVLALQHDGQLVENALHLERASVRVF